MDNLTHALAGAALAKTGLERTTPLATATLVLAANAPDIDVLAYARGEYFALAFRRGITHGIPAMAVLLFLVAGAVLAWDRLIRRRRRPDAAPARPGPVLALSGVGLLTHPALDWMNTYGMRWWLPLDPAWTYGDALFIIDPWLWLLLGGAAFLGGRWSTPGRLAWAVLCAAATLLVLLGPVPTGGKAIWAGGVAAVGWLAWARAERRRASRRHRTAAVLTILAAAYVGAMVMADASARADVRGAAAAAGLGVEDLMVAPAVANPLAADVEIMTPDGYVPGSHRWTRDPRVVLRPDEAVPFLTVDDPATSVPVAERVVAAAREVPEARDWLTWSRYPYVRVRRAGPAWSVTFADARYDGRGGAGGLSGVTVTVRPDEIAGRRPESGSTRGGAQPALASDVAGASTRPASPRLGRSATASPTPPAAGPTPARTSPAGYPDR